MVNHTVESANELLNKGEVPDIISCGVSGVNYDKYLNKINVNSGIDGGTINNSRYLVAWCKGGYFEIKRRGVKILPPGYIFGLNVANSWL